MKSGVESAERVLKRGVLEVPGLIRSYCSGTEGERRGCVVVVWTMRGMRQQTRETEALWDWLYREEGVNGYAGVMRLVMVVVLMMAMRCFFVVGG